MNKLSWVLYFADIAGNLQGLSIIGAIILVIYMGIGFDKENYNKNGAQEFPFYALFMGYHRGLLAFTIFLFIFVAITPSSTTIYMIAASESDEVVVNSQEVKDVFGLLKQEITKLVTEQEKSK